MIGLGLLFGGIILYDLRVLGFGKALSLEDLGRHLLPWVWLGFAINATSGLLLFSSGAIEFSANIALHVKLVLIAVAGLNAVLYHWRLHRLAVISGRAAPPSPSMKFLACTSILTWLCVILAGRMIAYVA